MGLSRRNIIVAGVGGASLLAISIGLGVGLKSDELVEPFGEEFLTRNTVYGKVRGLVYDRDNELTYNQLGKYDQNATHDAALFLGIPYAAAPVGPNRFKGPKDHAKWNDIRQPINPPSCAQKCHEPCPSIDEDCLYLNVYVPAKHLEEESSKKLPVLLWYHGGAFAWGAGSSFIYDGRYIAPEMDVVVVAVNYRLTAFGFLQLPFVEEGEVSNSNWGFQDQQKALQWVHDNIAEFGGDASRVTVAGQSAGGVSTSLHHISEISSPMVKNVIVQSNPLAIGMKENWEAMLQTAHMGHVTNCSNADPECLRQIPWQQLALYAKETPSFVNSDHLLHAAMPYAPIIDGVLIKEQIIDTLRDTNYNKDINVMAGIVEHESEIFVRTVAHNKFGSSAYKALFRALLKDKDVVDKIVARFPPCEDEDGSGDFESDNYTTDDSCQDVLCELLGQAICRVVDLDSICAKFDKNCDDRETIEKPATEWIFTCPNIEWLQKAETAQKNMWMYQFQAVMPLDISAVEGDDSWDDYERCGELSCHAAELSYEFSVEKTLYCPTLAEDKPDMVNCQPNGDLISSEMVEMEKQMHIYWRNFIHNGDPNDSDGLDGMNDVRWSPYSTDHSVMKLGFNALTPDNEKKPVSLVTNFKDENCAFWNALDLYANH